MVTQLTYSLKDEAVPKSEMTQLAEVLDWAKEEAID